MSTIQSYRDAAGNIHWKPDAYVASEKWYGIDLSDFLVSENDTITGVSWTVPAGLTKTSDRITNTNTQLEVKLKADAAGEYKVRVLVSTIENSDAQGFVWEINLKVLA